MAKRGDGKVVRALCELLEKPPGFYIIYLTCYALYVAYYIFVTIYHIVYIMRSVFRVSFCGQGAMTLAYAGRLQEDLEN